MNDQFPDFIAAEIVRRLPAQSLSNRERLTIARIFGVSLSAAKPDDATALSETLNPMSLHGPVYRGAIGFDIAVSGFNETQKINCRLLYAATIGDDNDRLTGEPIRIMHSVATRFQALVWNDYETSPEWIDLDERLIPTLAMRQVEELVETKIVAEEAAQKSAT
jgi:hypothetical protein